MNNIQVQKVAGTGGVLKGKAVKISSTTVVGFSAADDALLGVALHDALVGEIVAIAVAGEVDVEAGGSFSEQGALITNAAGEFVAQAASGSQVIDTYAKALEGGVDGRYVRVLLYEVPIAAVGA